MDTISWAFRISLLCVLYTYMGYPFLLWIRSKFIHRKIDTASLTPKVTIVISAWNAAATIARRLDNLLEQHYPADRMEILVVSDGSTDATGAIVAAYSDRNVRLVELEERGGKALALNHALKQLSDATSEIVVFADVRQYFEADALARLVANFNDPQVGCVSGELIFLKDDVSRIQVEMGAYWNYEKWIRKMESRTGSVVGATGAIYAIRRRLHIPLPPDTILDDVLTPLSIVRQGYRCIFEGGAVAFDTFSKGTEQEWQRKVRTLAGNWQLVSLLPGLLIPWRNPCWWRFVSHKLMRLIVPFALLILLVSTVLHAGVFYRVALLLQCQFYALALAAYLMPGLRKSRIASLVYFFIVMNAAAVAGFCCWLMGRSGSVWKPQANPDEAQQLAKS